MRQWRYRIFVYIRSTVLYINDQQWIYSQTLNCRFCIIYYYIIIFIIIYYYIFIVIYYYFLLKTRTVNSVLRNRNMIGKIPTWWENSVRGNRKTARKNSAMVGNFPQWEKKSLPLHGSFSTAAPVLYAGIYLPLFSQCIGGLQWFYNTKSLFIAVNGSLPWLNNG